MTTACWPTLDLLIDLGLGLGLVSLASDVFICRSPIHASWGSTACDPLTRIANSGSLIFSLNNSEYNSATKLGYYSPGNTNARTGFGIGTAVVLKIGYAGVYKYKRFYIGSIVPAPGVCGSRQTDIIAYDIMRRLAKQNVTGLAVQVSKRVDQALATLIALMPTAPLATAYSVSPETQDYIFTDIQDNTAFMTACQHLALTDAGYIFSKGDAGPTYGADKLIDGGLETWTDVSNLTNWNKNGTLAQETTNKYSGTYSAKLSGVSYASIAQNISSALTPGKRYRFTAWIKADTVDAAFQFKDYAVEFGSVSVSAGNSGLYSFEAVCPATYTGQLLCVCMNLAGTGIAYYDAVSVQEVIGGGETFCYENRQERQLRSSALTLNDTMHDQPVTIDENQVINHVVGTVFPGAVGVAPETMYQMAREMTIGAGKTITFQANYSEPAAGAGSQTAIRLVPGSGIAPVSGTDYMVTKTSGSGLNDATAWMTVTVTWFASYATISLTNTSSSFDIFCLPMKLRGTIIRLYNQMDATIDDTPANQQKYGIQPISYPMYYQNKLNFANDMANHWFNMWHLPVAIPQYTEFIANWDTVQMAAAVSLDIGSRYTDAETVTGINTDFCIMGIDMTIEQGSFLTVRYYNEPVNLIPACILNDAVYGVLDSVNCRVGF